MLLMPRDNFGFDFFDEMFQSPFFSNKSRGMMRTDVKEKDDNYVLDMDLPGVNKEDIKIDLENGYLSVTALQNNAKDEKDADGKYIRQERYSGQSSRQFYVGSGLSREDIRASYKDGILQLVFPKRDSKQVEEKKYIAIE